MKFCALLILVSFLVLPSEAWPNDYFAKGKVGETVYEVNYIETSKQITIIRQNKSYDFELTGYAATNFYVCDINHDKNDEVIFLDLTGVSVGGELRIIIWDEKSFNEVSEEFFANTITVDKIKDNFYILLIQHDTDDLFFVSDVLELDKKTLSHSNNASVWKKIIADYVKQMAGNIENWKKSRIHAYIATAYNMIGNNKKVKYHLNKARQLDKDNPFLNKIDNTKER